MLNSLIAKKGKTASPYELEINIFLPLSGVRFLQLFSLYFCFVFLWLDVVFFFRSSESLLIDRGEERIDSDSFTFPAAHSI